ncbi:hypothetical protein [Puerhibacterium puerhi]|uniref:hypothetical protein n=1 Tax=Puerhibacterium puerhi TaxID=2692623 RepID=UPI001357BA61|nr:hypothetical protein [Puerhibacterium puerhi]
MRTRLTRTTTALATTAVLALSLAACGGSGDETDAAAEETTASADATPTEEETAAEETPAEETPAEEETADAGAGDVCAASETLQDMSSIDTSDPAAAIAAFDELTTEFESVEPPAEIADDWNTVATSFREYTDTIQSVLDDPTAEDAVTKASDAAQALMSDEFMEAGTSISTYTATNC